MIAAPAPIANGCGAVFRRPSPERTKRQNSDVDSELNGAIHGGEGGGDVNDDSTETLDFVDVRHGDRNHGGQRSLTVLS